MSESTGPTRRTVVTGALGAGASIPALTLLSGCGIAQAPAPKKGTKLSATSQIPVGGGKVFSSAQVVVTQPSAGRFKAFSAICTHAGCLVGSVSGGQITCPCHGSTFSIKDGSVTGGPAPSPLPAQAIKVQHGEIELA